METIRELLGLLFKLAIAMIFIAFVWWIVTLLYPSLSLRGYLSKTEGGTDWLLAPRNVGLLSSLMTAPNETTNLYVPGPAYDGYGLNTKANLVEYNQTIAQPTVIRNLSIFEGGHIYTGISFSGEAKETIFRDGKFPILIVDNNGRIAGVSYAEQINMWATPGWARFQVKVQSVLPNRVQCSMIFQSANQQQVKYIIPITCN